MKKIVFLLFSLSTLLQAIGQDSIVYRKGKSIPVQILKYDKQRIYFKDFIDPEFSTRSEYLYKVKKLYYEGGSVKPVRNNLAKPFVGLTLGSSNPASYYANTNPNNTYQSGYAKQGGYASVFAGFYLFKNFGLQFSGRFFNNPFNLTTETVDNYISSIQGSSVLSAVTSKNSSANTKVRDNNKWVSRSFNIDLLYTVKFSRKFMLDIYEGIGVTVITKPEFNVQRTDSASNTNIYISSSSSKKTALIFTSGLRLKYELTRNFALCGGIETMFADREFTPQRTVTSSVLSQDKTSNVAWNQNILVMNVNVGVCYVLNRKLIK